MDCSVAKAVWSFCPPTHTPDKGAEAKGGPGGGVGREDPKEFDTVELTNGSWISRGSDENKTHPTCHSYERLHVASPFPVLLWIQVSTVSDSPLTRVRTLFFFSSSSLHSYHSQVPLFPSGTDIPER